MDSTSKWSDRPTSRVTDLELEEALSKIDIPQGRYVWVVRVYRSRELQTYTSESSGYENAMRDAATAADRRGGASTVETYQYSGKGIWIFVRTITITVTQPSRWGNPTSSTKTKLLK